MTIVSRFKRNVLDMLPSQLIEETSLRTYTEKPRAERQWLVAPLTERNHGLALGRVPKNLYCFTQLTELPLHALHPSVVGFFYLSVRQPLIWRTRPELGASVSPEPSEVKMT